MQTSTGYPQDRCKQAAAPPLHNKAQTSCCCSKVKVNLRRQPASKRGTTQQHHQPKFITASHPSHTINLAMPRQSLPSPLMRLWRVLVLVLAWSSSASADPDVLIYQVGTPSSDAAAVSYNQRSFIIDGKPRLLLSGSIHYTRVPPSDWNNVFRLAKVCSK